jgi:serine/threonine protein kinase
MMCDNRRSFFFARGAVMAEPTAASSSPIAADKTSSDRDNSTVAPGTQATLSDRPTVPGYEILAVLGRGGMGVVYRAEQIGLKRIVALKMILAGIHAGKQQLSRFRREAEAVAHLQHPNIVQIYEIGEHGGLPYFSMEYIEGGSLAQRLDGTPWQPDKAAALVEILARTMQAAHERGIIHRDLKPANVLLAPRHDIHGVELDPADKAPRYQPKIADFGLAKRLGSAETAAPTRTGAILGTSSYMAPEQASRRTKEIGAAADVYALGAILYELLTGRPPFKGPTPLDTVLLVVSEEVVAPGRLLPRPPRDLDTICLKCLEKDPAKRYQSALALAEDLRRFLSSRPILARPVGSVEKLWRWCKRNPKLAASAGLILGLLLVVSVGSTWAAIMIQKEKNEAVKARREADDARQRAQREKIIAEEQADLARETLGTLINQVQWRLNKAPSQQTLKRDLLQTALDGLKRVEKHGQNEGRKQRSEGEALWRLGNLAMETGNSKEACGYLEDYYRLMEAALQADPANYGLKSRLARACSDLGQLTLAVRRDLKKAMEYYVEALELRKQVAAASEEELQRHNAQAMPEDQLDPFYIRLNLSEAYTRIGLNNYLQGDSATAERPILQSLALREKLVAGVLTGEAAWSLGAPASAGSTWLAVPITMPWQGEWASEHRQNLARNYHLLGEIYFRLGNLEKSRFYYARCAGVREEVLKADEKDYRLKGDLGQFYEYYGTVYLRLGNPRDALPHYDRAVKLLREVVALDESVEFKSNLATALYSRGKPPCV